MKKSIKRILTVSFVIALAFSTPVLAFPNKSDKNSDSKPCCGCNCKYNKDKKSSQKAEINHGWLGIKVIDGGIEGFVDIVSGALVVEVGENSPLAPLGFSYGDLITEFDGKPVRNAKELSDYVSETKPGDKVVITTTCLNSAYYYKDFDYVVILSDESADISNEVRDGSGKED